MGKNNRRGEQYESQRQIHPRGSLAAVCMDTHHRREALANLGTFEPLPASAFAKEGTHTSTAIFTAKKSP